MQDSDADPGLSDTANWGAHWILIPKGPSPLPEYSVSDALYTYATWGGVICNF